MVGVPLSILEQIHELMQVQVHSLDEPDATHHFLQQSGSSVLQKRQQEEGVHEPSSHHHPDSSLALAADETGRAPIGRRRVRGTSDVVADSTER